MKSSKLGKNTSIRVENITPWGIWLIIKEKEYFIDFEEFPYFKEQKINDVQNVQLLHGDHLYWPILDIDLEIDNFENPTKYPLKSNQANIERTLNPTVGTALDFCKKQQKSHVKRPDSHAEKRSAIG
ncbi:MAG: DUF2442 domain-containing protein [Candidatus Riflebacteria bacterium]|nr:DUF2442 domain-containing protein [Candidatus Riflebacteria bacterium]